MLSVNMELKDEISCMNKTSNDKYLSKQFLLKKPNSWNRKRTMNLMRNVIQIILLKFLSFSMTSYHEKKQKPILEMRFYNSKKFEHMLYNYAMTNVMSYDDL